MAISEAVYTVGKAALNHVVQGEIKKDVSIIAFPVASDRRASRWPMPLSADAIAAFTDAGARAVIDAVWSLALKQQSGK